MLDVFSVSIVFAASKCTFLTELAVSSGIFCLVDETSNFAVDATFGEVRPVATLSHSSRVQRFRFIQCVFLHYFKLYLRKNFPNRSFPM